MTTYSTRVTKAANYMLNTNRLGKSITYSRLKSKKWAPIGWTYEWYEQTAVTAIVYDATTKDIEDSNGRIQLGDKAFSFLASALSGSPAAGDQISYNSVTYVVELTGQDKQSGIVIKKDITDSMYVVWARVNI